MKCLEEFDPEIWAEFMQGNWVVNKNTIPFCAIGADHALEQVNRMMKVGGGIVGITQNPSTLTKFFLGAPEPFHIAKEARQMAGMRSTEAKQHHDLMGTKARQQEDNVTALTDTIKKCIDPFSDQCDEVINILTKAIMPEKIQQDIVRRNEIGQVMYAAFVTDRITGNSINLWSPMKKCKLLTWSSSAVTAKIKDGDKIIELREDRALFARLLVVSKAHQIDLKYNLGKYKFSVLEFPGHSLPLMDHCITWKIRVN